MTLEQLRHAAEAWHSEDREHRGLILLTSRLEPDGTTLSSGIEVAYRTPQMIASIADALEDKPDVAQTLRIALRLVEQRHAEQRHAAKKS